MYEARKRHAERVERYPDVLGRAFTIMKMRRRLGNKMLGNPGRSKAERMLKRSLELEVEAARAFRMRGFATSERSYLYKLPRERAAVRADLAELERTLQQMKPPKVPTLIREIVERPRDAQP